MKEYELIHGCMTIGVSMQEYEQFRDVMQDFKPERIVRVR